MRSAAKSHVKMAKVSRWVPIQVYGDHAEMKSKSACLHRRGAREKSGILNINIPIFLNLPQEQSKLTEKKVGVTGHFEIFFPKNRFFLLRYIQKQACSLVKILTVNCQEI